MIRHWRKQGPKIQKALNFPNTSGRFRLPGGGMKQNKENKEMEEQLLASVLAYKANGIHLSYRNLCAMALQLSNNPEFKASMGWVSRFVRKNGLNNLNPKTKKPKLEVQEDSEFLEVEVELNEKIDQNESEDDIDTQSNPSPNMGNDTSTMKPMWKRNPDGSFSCNYEGKYHNLSITRYASQYI